MRSILPLLMVCASTAHADVRVVTDIAPVHSLVAQVMQGVGAPDVLVTGVASPHDFQFNFNQADAVQEADLIVWVGAGLTPWLDEALDTLAPQAPQLELLKTEGWPALDLRDEDDFASYSEGEHDHGHSHDHDHGHDHGAAVDPHAWLDPQVAIAWTGQIASALSALDPENATLYLANAEAAMADLRALEGEIAAMLDIPARPYIVPHDAYQYFELRFGHPATAAIALSDASAPTPDQIERLQATVADLGVVCVLTDPQARAAWSDLVAQGSAAQNGVRSVVLDPLGGTIALGPDHYRATMLGVAASYVACLS